MSFRYHHDSFLWHPIGDEKQYLLMTPQDQHAAKFTIPTITGNFSLTGCGFQPDCVILMGSFAGGIGTTSGRFYFGCATSSDSDQQWCLSCSGGYLPPTHRVKSFRTGHCIDVTQKDGTEPLRASLVSFDADGFTLNFDIAGDFVNYPDTGYRGYPITELRYLALKGDFLAGTMLSGGDISGAPFRPKGLWIASTKQTSEGVKTNDGWHVGQGFASVEGQACITGAAVDVNQMISTGTFSSGYYDTDHCLAIIRPRHQVASTPTHDILLYMTARLNAFTSDGVSLYWENQDPTIFTNEYLCGYLLVGEDAEAGAFHESTLVEDPNDYRDVATRIAPTAMLTSARGNVTDVNHLQYLYGGHAYLSFGALNDTGWLDRGSSDPPEEFFTSFAESGGGFGTGGGFQLTDSGEGDYWQCRVWIHDQENGGFPQDGINVVSTSVQPQIIDMMWRDARRQQGRTRTPAKGSTAG